MFLPDVELKKLMGIGAFYILGPAPGTRMTFTMDPGARENLG